MTTTTTAPDEAQDSHGHMDPARALVQPQDEVSGPIQTRSERPRSFDPADFGVPTGREVNWMHTPMKRIAPLFEAAEANDGVMCTVTSGAEYASGTLAIGEAPRGEFFQPEDLPAAIAWVNSADALHVQLPRETEVAEPIVIDIVGQGADKRADGHIVIEAQPMSKGIVILQHSGAAQYAQNVEIIARDGSHLTVITLQDWSDGTVHASSHQARVDRDASLKHFVITFGGDVVRVNPSLELSGQGSNGEMFGLTYSDAGQHLESQVYLFHKGAHTKGDVLYKGALQGNTARSVWIGDVLIGPDATGTDSYEANRNLLLTNGTRADSIPNLEIQTGDIEGAGHASATGRFDDEQLFYLQARGISEEEARRLVVLGFLVEIAQKIEVPELQEHLIAAVEKEIAEGVKA
ncbi:Fe-S cluster assembly protein SufD [Microbacterium amylolyticum]|uniref:Fe-S cluster assembly protein SufD n=1 Tax=Microbacterium amylolyticum TaxID=936337 RepID=A0ABS4ZKN6_9MICO|nr:Fe-S cluster assembly protein SufD [Microbacterium amylolyticum]MBP2437857.1 Fe-S cluster assembly protein SufD [Microbacterium amylolyticum]